MTELSIYGKIFLALELAKDAGVGCEFTHLEAIELLGHIRSLNETIGLDNVRIAELEARYAVLREVVRPLARTRLQC